MLCRKPGGTIFSFYLPLQIKYSRVKYLNNQIYYYTYIINLCFYLPQPQVVTLAQLFHHYFRNWLNKPHAKDL